MGSEGQWKAGNDTKGELSWGPWTLHTLQCWNSPGQQRAIWGFLWLALFYATSPPSSPTSNYCWLSTREVSYVCFPVVHTQKLIHGVVLNLANMISVSILDYILMKELKNSLYTHFFNLRMKNFKYFQLWVRLDWAYDSWYIFWSILYQHWRYWMKSLYLIDTWQWFQWEFSQDWWSWHFL